MAKFESVDKDIPNEIAPGLKGYCTVFQHTLKLLELTGIDLT